MKKIFRGYAEQQALLHFLRKKKRLNVFVFFCFFIFQSLAFSENTVRITALPGTVALTFDDGPSPIYTPQVLAILKKYNIKATFFMVGENAEAHPALVRQVLAAGHSVNNHTMTHAMLTKLSDTGLYREVVVSENTLAHIMGKKPICLRYPFGASNSRVREYIRAHGIVPVSMGFNSFDYERRGTDKLISWVLKNAYSRQVILMHDGYFNKEQTVAALPAIIEGIQKKGLGFSLICS